VTEKEGPRAPIRPVAEIPTVRHVESPPPPEGATAVPLADPDGRWSSLECRNPRSRAQVTES